MNVPYQPAPRRVWRSLAFSLVELLVVVAIIGVLASLLLAALPAGRERARRATCRGNLRQIAVALNAYGGDNSDALPPAHTTNDIQRRGGGRFYLPLVVNEAQRSLVRYGGSSNILDCPNLVSAFVRSNDWRAPLDSQYVQIGYFYLAGRPETPWSVTSAPVRTNWNSPQKLSDDPAWVVAADLSYMAPCVSRLLIAHTSAGAFVGGQEQFIRAPFLISLDEVGRRTQSAILAGAFNARLDGSVNWRNRRQAEWLRAAKEVDGSADNQTCIGVW